jgi:hypothetical protein
VVEDNPHPFAEVIVTVSTRDGLEPELAAVDGAPPPDELPLHPATSKLTAIAIPIAAAGR